MQRPAACISLPRIPAHIVLLLLVVAACPSWASDCIAIHQASQHVGETKCVAGKVLRVKLALAESTFSISAKIRWPALSPWWSFPAI